MIEYNDNELLYLINEGSEIAQDILFNKYAGLIKKRISLFKIKTRYRDDFYQEGMNRRIVQITSAVETIKKRYPEAKITHEIKDQYENMKPYVMQKFEVVTYAMEALKKNGIEPKIGLIRGGTDGATMSKNGLITPNLGTASYNHHGRFEYLDVQEYEKMIEVIIDLMKL